MFDHLMVNCFPAVMVSVLSGAVIAFALVEACAEATAEKAARATETAVLKNRILLWIIRFFWNISFVRFDWKCLFDCEDRKMKIGAFDID